MKKKLPRNVDTTEALGQIQEQLAVLNNKFDDFINKSLTDLAQTLAAQKAAAAPRPVPTQATAPIRPLEQNRRPKFAIVCFQCGKDSELPFKPTPGRAVYCPECFAMRKSGQIPKVTAEVKPLVEVQMPVEIKKTETPKAKGKNKTPASKKTVAKKTVAKKTARKKK